MIEQFLLDIEALNKSQAYYLSDYPTEGYGVISVQGRRYPSTKVLVRLGSPDGLSYKNPEINSEGNLK